MSYILFDTTNGITYKDVSNLNRFARRFKIKYKDLRDTVRGKRATAIQHVGDREVEWVGYDVFALEQEYHTESTE
jgi:hypothetical protein